MNDYTPPYNNMGWDFSDKIAVVTGGAKGIGKAITEKLLSYNTTVIIIYNNSQEAAENVCKAAENAGRKAYAIGCNVTNPSEVKNAFEYIEKTFKKLDFLINNAGITKDNLLIRMKDEEWLDVVSTNLNGVFYCTRSAVKLMLRKRYGRIINISSIVGISGNPGQSNYAATKAGIIGFTKAAAKEMGGKNILVNAIAPGYIETDMVSVMPEEFKTMVLGNIPLHRYGTPEDVAGLVCFLLSDDAGYINGAIVDINGGIL